MVRNNRTAESLVSNESGVPRDPGTEPPTRQPLDSININIGNNRGMLISYQEALLEKDTLICSLEDQTAAEATAIWRRDPFHCGLYLYFGPYQASGMGFQESMLDSLVKQYSNIFCIPGSRKLMGTHYGTPIHDRSIAGC